MTVKPQMQSYIYAGLLSASFVMVDCLFPLEFGKAGLWGVVIFNALCIMPAFLCIAHNCSTLHFSELGCTVSCLGLRKFTPWDKLVICQEEKLRDFCSFDSKTIRKKPNAGAVFSSNKKMRPKWMAIEAFCMYRNPFTTFYVAFNEENAKHGLDAPHVVDREAFLATLASFGIQLNKRQN